MDKWMVPNLAGLEIKPETLKLIAAIDEFKGAWRHWSHCAGTAYLAEFKDILENANKVTLRLDP